MYIRLLNGKSIQFMIETAPSSAGINMMKLFLLLCIFQLLKTNVEGVNRFKGGKLSISIRRIRIFRNSKRGRTKYWTKALLKYKWLWWKLSIRCIRIFRNSKSVRTKYWTKALLKYKWYGGNSGYGGSYAYENNRVDESNTNARSSAGQGGDSTLFLHLGMFSADRLLRIQIIIVLIDPDTILLEETTDATDTFNPSSQ